MSLLKVPVAAASSKMPAMQRKKEQAMQEESEHPDLKREMAPATPPRGPTKRQRILQAISKLEEQLDEEAEEEHDEEVVREAEQELADEEGSGQEAEEKLEADEATPGAATKDPYESVAVKEEIDLAGEKSARLGFLRREWKKLNQRLVDAGGVAEEVPWKSARPVVSFEVSDEEEDGEEAKEEAPELAATARFKKVPMLPIGAKAKPPVGFTLRGPPTKAEIPIGARLRPPPMPEGSGSGSSSSRG
jgi:hypothetical protein